MYLFGIGTKKDKDEANNWMQKAKQYDNNVSKLSFLDLWENFE